jgi:hypothetical protein
MLLPLLAGAAHLPVMIVVAALVFAERLEAPAPLVWQWRGGGKALRIVVAQARLRFMPRRLVEETST